LPDQAGGLHFRQERIPPLGGQHGVEMVTDHLDAPSRLASSRMLSRGSNLVQRAPGRHRH
jgi:hypothetical protein